MYERVNSGFFHKITGARMISPRACPDDLMSAQQRVHARAFLADFRNQAGCLGPMSRRTARWFSAKEKRTAAAAADVVTND